MRREPMQLNLDFIENEHEKQAFMFSVGVIGLSVIAVLAFVFSGGSIFFYIFAILAVALGLYMSYHLSKTPESTNQKPEKKRSGRR